MQGDLWTRLTGACLLAFLLLCAPGFPEDTATRLPVVRLAEREYLGLDSLIAAFSLDAQFDMISGRGTLYSEGHRLTYRVGMAAAILDGDIERAAYPVVRDRGRVLIPLELARLSIERFYSALRCELRHDTLLVGKRVQEAPREPVTTEPAVPAQEPPAVKPGKDRIAFIVIDPGHGGKDPGALSSGGIREKNITLSISRLVRAGLEKRLPGVRISLTREKDIFIELATRTDIANRKLRRDKNGLFLSVHVNASITPLISGFETYFLSQNPSNEDARNTAALENNVIVLEERKHRRDFEDVAYIEAAMLTTQILKESSSLAQAVHKGLGAQDTLFKSRGVRNADFYVLRGVLMPAALVEVGFITNPKEARALLQKAHQELIARGIVDGVVEFVGQYNGGRIR